MYIISVIVTLCCNIIAVVGMVVMTGYTGMFSMGHAGFMAIGAYTSVLLNRYGGVPFVPALVLGGLAAAVISVLVGIAPIRNKLSGDSFSICMLGFGSMVRLIFVNLNNPVTKGATGISGIPRNTSLFFALALTAFMVYLTWNFVHSQYGKNCVAVQQQAVAAEMMGVSIVRTKLLSLVISAYYAGVAGGLLVFWTRYLNPGTFADTRSNDLVSTLVAGGTNSVSGPILAAAILIFALEYLRALVEWRLVIYGGLLVVLMRFRPQGVMGYKEFSLKGTAAFLKSTVRFFRDYREIPAKVQRLFKKKPAGLPSEPGKRRDAE